jgi:hypothetical protein
MKMKVIMKIIISFLILLNLTPNLFSQGGSSYSLVGIGDINYSGNASYEGMGGVSIALPSKSSINFRNPALWSYSSLTRLQTGYKFNQHFIERDNLSGYQNNGSLSNMSILFAIDTSNGIAASFGLYPYSNINYLSATPIQDTLQGIPLNGTTTYQGKGGISIAYLGVSTKILKNLSLGLSAFAAFGNVSASRLTAYTNDNYLFTYTTQKSDYFSGFGMKVGIFYEPVKNFGIGYFFESQPNLDVNSNLTYSSPVLGDTVLVSDNAYKIPNSNGVGLSYLTGVYQFGMDFSVQDFTGFQYNPGNKSQFQNSWQFCFGIEKLGDESINAETMDRIAYKLGFSSKKMYYNFFNNDILEYAVHTGLQIPWTSTLVTDISFTIGTRGTLNSGLVREYFGKLGIDISLGETWFVPFKRDY